MKENRFANRYKVSSHRLQNWDYSTIGYYFITICTYQHNNFFGKIINGEMKLSKLGIIANQCLINISKHFSNISLNEYTVMPNHVHILFHVETPDLASLQKDSKNILIKYNYRNHPDYFLRLNQLSKQLIPKVIQQYKSTVTRLINPKIIFFAWQPSFYDHIVKDKKELLVIKKYIKDNVINWKKDKYYA